MTNARTRRIVIEMAMPEGLEWLGGVAEELVRRLVSYAILQAKARVWERVKHAYTGG